MGIPKRPRGKEQDQKRMALVRSGEVPRREESLKRNDETVEETEVILKLRLIYLEFLKCWDNGTRDRLGKKRMTSPGSLYS